MSEPDYASRLLRLAAFLEKLPPEKFDYRCWVGRDWKGAQDLSCGTTGCAFGWAPTALPTLGLEIRRTPEEDSVHVVFHSDPEIDDTEDPLEVTLGAAARAFGLSGETEAEELFLPGEYCDWLDRANADSFYSPRASASATEVAAHLRAFAKHKWGRE